MAHYKSGITRPRIDKSLDPAHYSLPVDAVIMDIVEEPNDVLRLIYYVDGMYAQKLCSQASIAHYRIQKESADDGS